MTYHAEPLEGKHSKSCYFFGRASGYLSHPRPQAVYSLSTDN
jgi:hypothetical protein